ncbi:unnamed protein product [Urochloa humidicola]
MGTAAAPPTTASSLTRTCSTRSSCASRPGHSAASAPSPNHGAPSSPTTRHRGHPLFAVAVEGDSGSGTKGSSSSKVAEIKFLDTSGRAVKTVSTGLVSPLIQMGPHLDLVLLSGLSRDRRLSLDRKALRLLDPATGAVSSLPRPNRSDSSFSRPSFVLGRAVVSSNSNAGGHGEYKVVSLNMSSLYAAQLCKVLTIGGGEGGGDGGTWRAAPSPPVRIKAFGGNGTVVANGVVYHLVDNVDTWSVAAFDLEEELWRPSLLQGPVTVSPSIDGHAQRSLAELNGRLAAVSTTVLIMDIWLLRIGSSGKRFKQCRVRTSSIQQDVWPSAMHVDPLWVMDDGRIALWVRAGIMTTRALWMYDPRTGTCTKVAVTENCLDVGVGVYTGNLLL